jgi:hypothetical protein
VGWFITRRGVHARVAWVVGSDVERREVDGLIDPAPPGAGPFRDRYPLQDQPFGGWREATSHTSLADRQLRASQARQSSALPATTMLTSLLMSGSWPRREDIHVVLVVHHAEEVALSRRIETCAPTASSPPSCSCKAVGG